MVAKNTSPEYVCIREKQINKHETAITELNARADFKEQRITDLHDNMEKMDKKLDNIQKQLQDLKMQSFKDDSDIDNRVTALENTVKVLKWITATALSALSVLIAVLAFALVHLH